MRDTRAQSNNSAQPYAFSYVSKPKAEKASNTKGSPAIAAANAINGSGGVVGQKVDYIK